MENLTAMQAAGVFGFLGGFVGVLVFVMLFIFVLEIVAEWRIFGKAGIAPWLCLIPIVGEGYMWGKVYSVGMYIIFLALSVAASIISQDSGHMTTAMSVVTLIICIIAIVLYIKYIARYSKAFGHGAGFAVGFFFFPTIFKFILAFGKSEYVGKP